MTLDSASGSGKPRNFRKDPDLDRSETLETPDYKGASAALDGDSMRWAGA